MTYIPNYDRAHWRDCPDTMLIEAARDSGHELSIALGERLDAATGADVEHLRNENEELEATIDALRQQVASLESRLASAAQEEPGA
jgi:predicted RNase H-like nuclease (RuvC/YqgF family)